MSQPATYQPSLSSKCSICHGPPKYTCPRCAARTCSLPCVKVHKARSLCSGERNPGAYLTRAKLGQPAAFDSDFNFISGLERQLERGEKVLGERGLARAAAEGIVGERQEPELVTVGESDEGKEGEGAAAKQVQGGQRKKARGDAAVRKACDEAEIRIRTAPAGLERSRRNKTRWHPRSGSVQWSVEWVLDGGKRREYGMALDKKSMSEAWEFHLNSEGGKAQTESCQPGVEDQPSVGNTHFLLHISEESRGRTKTVILVEPATLLKDALKGCEVVEFPTFEIAATDPVDLDGSLYAVYKHRLDVGNQSRRLNLSGKKRVAEEPPDTLPPGKIQREVAS